MIVAGHVIVLSRDRGFATIAGRLVDYGQVPTCFASPAELPDWLRPRIGAVVLDFPRRARGIVYRQLRQRYHGPVLALLDPGEVESGLPDGRGCLVVLHRPFSGEELSASLGTLVAASARNESPGARAPAATTLGTALGTAAVGGTATATPAVGGPTATPAVDVTTTRATRRRRPAWQRLDPLTRRRVKGWAFGVGVAVLLLVGISLSGGSDCGSTGCTNVAGAVENGGLGGNPGLMARPLGSHTAPPGVQPVAASKESSTQPATAPPGMSIPIASGVGDLIAGTSSSSGGAPLLVVMGGGSSPPATGGGVTSGSSGGSAGGGTTSPTTTQPPATVAPTTAPPTTEPPTTAPPTTEPPTTAPPTTEPPTTAPPTTDPSTTDSSATTEPPTTDTATTSPTTDPATTAATTGQTATSAS